MKPRGPSRKGNGPLATRASAPDTSCDRRGMVPLFRRAIRAPVRLVAAWAAVMLLSGCAGYQLGFGSLYRPDVRTVHVPIFQSDSFRPHLGERLTEVVVKEIELRTPYKVVDAASADSVLYGRVVDTRKRVLVEDENDEPRDLEAGFVAEFSWVDRRGNLIARSLSVPVPALVLTVRQTADFVPEGGQSLATAQQEALARLAAQIVNQMERPW